MEEYKNRHRPQDDLPYERRMLYIIQDYRKLLEQNERLADYCKKLERDIENLRLKRTEQGLTNKNLAEICTKRSREIKRLKVRIDWLEEQLKQYEQPQGS